MRLIIDSASGAIDPVDRGLPTGVTAALAGAAGGAVFIVSARRA